MFALSDGKLLAGRAAVLLPAVVYREELESVEHVGAWRWIERNLSVGDGSTQVVRLAAMTASGFRLTRSRHCWDGRWSRRTSGKALRR